MFLWSCQELPLIRAPFEGIENDIHRLTFDVSKGGVLSLPNGTRISVPPDAFVNAEGAQVSGEVNLSYTEMQDMASILISGIPLNLGEGKDMDVMESAVMFDIRADQNGQPLRLAEGKSIGTTISSDKSDSAYNLYRLNEQGGSWDYLDNIAPEPNPVLVSARQRMESANGSVGEMDLSNCIAFNYLEYIDVWKKPKDNLFNYYTYTDYPNLNTLKGLVREKLKGYGAGYVDAYCYESVKYEGRSYPIPMILWEPEKPLADNAYKLKGVSLDVKKVKGGRYVFSLQRYKSGQYADNGKWIKGKWITLYSFYARPKMPLASLYANPMKEWTATYDSLLQEIEAQKAVAAMQNEVVRNFAINELGIYNYDIIKDEERILVNAEPVMNGESIREGTDFFAVLKGRNSVIRYSPEGLKRFVLYPGQDIYLFKLTKGNQVLQMKGNPLAGLDLQFLGNKESPEIEIEFEKSDYRINTAEDVEDFIAEVTGTEPDAIVMRMRSVSYSKAP